VSINGFNDGQQDFRFFVSAANIQMDCWLQRERRFSWDAIWKSKATITFGWVVEMKILMPLCAFPMQKTNLGLNFMREIKRDVQKIHGIESILKLAL
jgi:hypothetical protein